MYAIIDLHGLPGSHNGEVTSGHLTRNPTFFQDANQQRSRETVKAALEYITTSPYRSVVSALQVINEVCSDESYPHLSSAFVAVEQ